VSEIKEQADLRAWEKRRKHISLLHYGNEENIRPIWQETESAVLEKRSAKFHALPVLHGNSSLAPEYVAKIVLPSEAPLLGEDGLKTLRAAAVHLLRN